MVISTRFTISIVLAVWVLTACGTATFAQSVSLNPVADAFVHSIEATGNYGGAGVVGMSTPGLPNGELQSVLRFDLAPAKSSFDLTYGAGNWSLSSASLQLAASAPNNSIFNASNAGQFKISWLQNDAWVEGTGTPTSPGATGITWNSLPSFLSASDQDLGTFSFDGSTTATASYTLAISTGLTNDAAIGGLASLRLSAASGDTTISGLFNSRSFGTASRRPLLTLNAVAVPEPATAFLAACGIASLIFAGLRSRRTRDTGL